jgi:hypothetical protein
VARATTASSEMLLFAFLEGGALFHGRISQRGENIPTSSFVDTSGGGNVKSVWVFSVKKISCFF